uniref:Titin n=1 Tax=Anser brachyrhynchus TaxID=132585 RepID=A0A8B9BGN9_9AVES
MAREQHVKAGDTLRLSAVIKGVPFPKVSWKKEDHEVSPKADIEITGVGSKLEIRNTVHEDGGIYSLTVENPAGSKTVSVKVVVLGNLFDVPFVLINKDELIRQCAFRVPGLIEGNEYKFRIKAVNIVGEGEPRELAETVLAKDILSPPEVNLDVTCRDLITVRVGQTIRITGKVKGRPDPEITWSKDGKVLVQEKRVEIVHDLPNVELQVKEAKRSDHGKYIIAAKNSCGHAQAFAIVNVLDRPGPCQNLKISYVTKDSCMIAWESPVDNGGSEITNYIVEYRQPNQRGWSIVSSDITKRLVKANLIENREYFFREDLQKPVLDLKLSGVLTVKAGDPIRIEAGVRGKPQPEVVWTKDKDATDLTRSPRISIETTSDTSKFVLTQSRRSDGGKYVITATNTAGSFVAYATVIVLDKPGPVRNLKVTDISSDRCTVTWEPPEDDGGCEIQNYILEKCESKRMVWSTYSSSVLTNYANVTRLIEGNEYIFRVRAENKMGTGPPTETHPIIAKTKYDRPGRPDPPEVTRVSKEEMTVVWNPPEYDGGKSITGYILEKKEKRSLRWVPVTKTAIPERRKKVTNLIPGHEYQFRVSAENEVGLGEPSLPSRPVVAKDPIGIVLLYTTVVCLFVFNVNRLLNCITIFLSVTSIVFQNREPDPPRKLEVTEITKNSATLGWLPPLRDGGSKIDGYIVSYKEDDQPADRWTEYSIVKDLSIVVAGLKEGKKYKFRVAARNAVGVSLPRETEGVFEIKEQLSK